MILTVTPNAALDITYEIDRLVPGASHRVRRLRARAGGKGVNVTSVLMSMGYETLATGFAGGPPGQTILADLTDRGVPHLFTDVLGSSRRNIKVHDGSGEVTRFNEPGPPVPWSSWEQLRASLEPLVAGPATALVSSGKLPAASPPDAVVGILELAQAHGVPSVVDAAGPVLLGALSAAPDLVKPNRAELAEVCPGLGVVAAARELQRRGAKDVAVSLGRDGVVLVPIDGPVLRAFLPVRVEGDPTGSGDALVAALSTGVGRDPWEELLRRAVSWSGAAVRQPVAGLVNPNDVAELEPLVVVEPLRGELDAA
ncbi:Tagatose-6-phosphate kinase [Austwickia sp. TVS 96-490-7B]|uniref:1-phosphofructokinase family hexose kinase n=1 Tax=Austwickia sp. TVS 96-490-7B TaxID=2830843 RepID=UPI001C59A955|nr:1-phosphofructokinase family hexose kinase [Austwickia sp. TVS 96-490-7B]MBW3086867.1 Tagatose-6-phosphate kinase [Austwickia sp. TVS 96-490-7B]